MQQSAGHTGDADRRKVQLPSDFTGRRVQTGPQDRLAGDATPMDLPARPSPYEVGQKNRPDRRARSLRADGANRNQKRKAERPVRLEDELQLGGRPDLAR